MRIFLECKGRMANQIAAWAKASCRLQSILPEVTFLINYPELADNVHLPNVEHFYGDTRDWKRFHYGEEYDGESVWEADDLWNQTIPVEAFCERVRTMQFSKLITDEVDALMASDRFVGFHVRYGDYVKINPKRPPVPLPPFVRANKQHFLSSLNTFNTLCPGRKLFLATDAKYKKLRWVPPHVRNRDDANPAMDLYALSKCEFIIGSNSSFTMISAIYGDREFTIPGFTRADLIQKCNRLIRKNA